MTEAGAAELAVVIVNYDTGDYLERCLASIRRHRGDAVIDVVVVDNASSDGSHTRAVTAHPWARLVENPSNVYLSPAWNQGARATSAPYLLFLNPDTEWWKGTLSDLLRVAHTHPRAGIVGPLVRDPDGRVFASGRTFPSVVNAVGHAFISPFSRENRFTRRYELDGWDRKSEREVDWVSGCCMLMPRDAFDRMGGFDEGFPLYAEELDMATRLRDDGWHVLFSPEVEILHEIGVSTPPARWTSLMHSRSVYRYYRKHRAAGVRRLTLPFAWAALRLRAEVAWLRGRFPGR
jgi:N-acetylglucosaminyl-diphospho-decaprenol L-rhamnosyltransferase